MARDIVMHAEDLGKSYLIGHRGAQEPYATLREGIARSVRGWRRSAHDLLRGRQIVGGDEVEEFWALRHLDFEVRQGEVVGIIGRNGAGKSTLLKILSRITEPTEGRVTINGRVASLLEVGTGFHPELTGRENIFLNGAILGMSRVEIRRKFDEIVAFAEVERFLDTPVKRYSSGMYVRLAFAVAAHLEPEILVVDEVLSVGDTDFQAKCIGKMNTVAQHGRTVLFVSHDLGAIRSLCSTGIVCDRGQIRYTGPISEAMEEYQRIRLDPKAALHPASREGTQYAMAVINDSLEVTIRQTSQILTFSDSGVEIRALLISTTGHRVGMASIGGFGAAPIPPGMLKSAVVFKIRLDNLASGTYELAIEILDRINNRVFTQSPPLGFEFHARTKAGEAHALNASWSHGFVRFEAQILPV